MAQHKFIPTPALKDLTVEIHKHTLVCDGSQEEEEAPLQGAFEEAPGCPEAEGTGGKGAQEPLLWLPHGVQVRQGKQAEDWLVPAHHQQHPGPRHETGLRKPSGQSNTWMQLHERTPKEPSRTPSQPSNP